MPIIKLSHLEKLKYLKITKKNAPELPDDIVLMSEEGATVVTFRLLRQGKPARTIKHIDATHRFSDIKSTHLVLYALEMDSPLAPLILWDLAHAAPINGKITVVDNLNSVCYLQRKYFSELKLISSNNGHHTFLKLAPLAAEVSATGLDGWTFGIPVGPEDATLLNATIERILDIKIPNKEILLCGKPGENFKYLDKVRIVGEDITAPPVKICAKKNRLAQEAKYENLCIIHDRVYLPINFDEVIQKFGDAFPFVAFQSVYFEDKWNFLARRYSDYGVSHRVRSASVKGVMRDNDVFNPSEFAPEVLAKTELSGFFTANVLRYSLNHYLTGSLYICKKSVWMKCPQNENLYWTEFEDLEQGFRASDMGIPSRVNPYAITQSLIARPLLTRAVGGFIEDAKGVFSLHRPFLTFMPFPRKPMIKISLDKALFNMSQFSHKYVPSVLQSRVHVSSVYRMTRRLSSVEDILSRSKIQLQKKYLKEFLDDFEKWVVMDQLPYNWKEHVCHNILIQNWSLVDALLHTNDSLIDHAALRPKGKMFYKDLHDYLPKKSVLNLMGMFISACCLYVLRRRVVYIKGGIFSYFRALQNTTPYYSSESKK